MEADHRRFFFQQHVQHVRVFDERGVDLTQRRRWGRIEFTKKRGKNIQPLRLPNRVMHGRPMAEQVHIKGLIRQCSRCSQHVARLLDAARPDTDGTEPARIRYRRCEPGRGNTHHGRLDDGQFDVQQGQQWIGHKAHLGKNRERGVRPPGTTDGVQARAYTPSHPKTSILTWRLAWRTRRPWQCCSASAA